MKDLKFILKRMTQVSLAEKLGLTKANITLWKSSNAVPRKHYSTLREIRNELREKTGSSSKE